MNEQPPRHAVHLGAPSFEAGCGQELARGLPPLQRQRGCGSARRAGQQRRPPATRHRCGVSVGVAAVRRQPSELEGRQPEPRRWLQVFDWQEGGGLSGGAAAAAVGAGGTGIATDVAAEGVFVAAVAALFNGELFNKIDPGSNLTQSTKTHANL